MSKASFYTRRRQSRMLITIVFSLPLTKRSWTGAFLNGLAGVVAVGSVGGAAYLGYRKWWKKHDHDYPMDPEEAIAFLKQRDEKDEELYPHIPTIHLDPNERENVTTVVTFRDASR